MVKGEESRSVFFSLEKGMSSPRDDTDGGTAVGLNWVAKQQGQREGFCWRCGTVLMDSFIVR